MVKTAEANGVGLFASEMQKAMEAKELGIKEVADATESTYEHIRKILRASAYPSKYFLRVLCDALDLDLGEMERLVIADRLRHKYGGVPEELAGKNPELAPLDAVWDDLTEEHKRDLIAQARAWAKLDRQSKSERKKKK